ncbi:HEAT repeat domain-containing protein [Lacipirellula sp.]|uniref:HEAT repeat domain-containing protein n=1 Tax=Lacipirellula sp. TaxID=2691419 RepID=UPI003D0A0AF9
MIRDLNDPALASSVMETIKSREAELDPRDVSEAMVTVAKLSQKGKRQQAAFEFFVDYLNHPRQTLQSSAIRGLGELHDPAARPLLAPIAANKVDAVLAAAAKAALAELDQKTPLVPAEVGDLRKEVRELREEQAKLQKSLDELKEKSAAAKKAAGDEKKGEKPTEK